MNEKILVVDDDELVRTGLAANLERAGFEVFTSFNAGQTKKLMAEHDINLVLCDLVLGDENGMDILRHLQATQPEVAVVILTGHGSVRNALEALKGGASDYIQKPSDPEEVIHRIRMVLDSVKLRRTLTEERHRTEERKKIIHEQLNRAERMSSLGMLAEGAARDLKEILRPIEGIPDEIRRKIDPLHASHVKLLELDEALHKASAVIRDLEAIGKSNTLKKTSLHVNELVAEYLKSQEYFELIERHPKVKVETKLSRDIPTVIGSSPHLRQMIANLTVNAFESMSTGGHLRIKTTAQKMTQAVGRFGSQKPGEYVAIRFEDTALRMSGEDVERIFEPFYMRNRMGRRLLSGLGLTLVYRVVEDHGGFVDISTEEEVGNALTIFLPISDESESAVLELRPDYTGRERVLLIDDSESQRISASDMLKELGYDVETAENGHVAVELVKKRLEKHPDKKPFDLLVIDLVLGDVFDGVETYSAILDLFPGQKAVLASGFADITRIVEARKLGITRCFQKPYSIEVLGKNIRMALDEG
jgi:DNA-binding response OmpR family regulator